MKKVNLMLPLALASLLLAGCDGPSKSEASSQGSVSSETTSSATSEPSSSVSKMPAVFTSPASEGTLAIVDPLVKQYWDLSVDPSATDESPDDSLTLLNAGGTLNRDRQVSQVTFKASKSDTYVVRLSLTSDFASSFDRRTTSASNVYTANLLTLYPKTSYYAEVVDSSGAIVSDVLHFTTEDAPRFLNSVGSSPYNFRDAGGYSVGTGKRVRYGMLYRGRQIDTMDHYGREVMGQELGINSEIDLRNAGGDTGFQTVNMIDLHHPFFSCPLTGYEHNIGDVWWEQGIKGMFQALATPANYPVYFHCTYGRDRTGVAAFLINGLCGVSFADLTRDYELTSFSESLTLRTSSSDYGSWQALYAAVMAKGASGDSLKTCIEKYLLSLGITQAQIDAIRTTLIEDDTAAIPNSEYYVAASLKAPCHVAVSGGSVDKVWVEDGDRVTLTAASPLSGQTFNGWSDGSSVVSTDLSYTTTVNANCAYSATYTDDEAVVEAEKNDLLYSSSVRDASHAAVVYEAVDNPTVTTASRRAYKFACSNLVRDWPYVTLKLATPITVKSGVFSLSAKHNAGSVNWMSIRYFDSSMTLLGTETGAEPGTGDWKTVSYNAPNNCVISYLRFAGNTKNDTGSVGFEIVLDELHFQATESVEESGTAGATGYTMKKLENLPLDSGMSAGTSSADYTAVVNTDSVCSLKTVLAAHLETWKGNVTFNLADGVKLGYINALPNVKAGTLEGYFKFSSDMATPVVKVAVAFDGDWSQTGYVAMALGEADSNGWRKGSLNVSDLADLYSGTSSAWTGAAVRFVFAFGEVSQTGTVNIDELAFTQGDISSYVKEAVVETGTRGASGYRAANLENFEISSDSRCTYVYDKSVTHSGSGHSVKMGYTSAGGAWPRFSLQPTTPATFTMATGTLSAYFKFGSSISNHFLSVKLMDTSWNAVKNPSDSSKEAEFDFTLTDQGDGWYYGTVDMSQFAFSGGVQLIRLNSANDGTGTEPYVWVDQITYSIA